MSRRYAVGIIVTALLALGGLALAQQERPAAAGAPAAGGERFAVSGSGDSAVLLETATGKTWTLHRSAIDGNSVWLPATRLDSLQDIERWRNREKEFRLQQAEDTRRQLQRDSEKRTTPK